MRWALASLLLVSASQVLAADVWVNQVGFDPAAPKRARIVSDTDLGSGPLSFQIVGAGGAVYTGDAPYAGVAWGRHVWWADFDAVQTPGSYQVSAQTGGSTSVSDTFIVGADRLGQATAQLAAEFFFVQRCGVEVPGRHAACHTDDAEVDGGAPPNATRDVTGGWHDAGDYNKYAAGFFGHALYAVIDAWEVRPDLWQRDTLDPNGVPDIIDEAMHGADFAVRMVAADGKLWGNVLFDRNGSSWVRPENDTDNVRGNPDDRLLVDNPEPNGQAGLVAAGLAKLHRVLANDPTLPAPPVSYLQSAVMMWDHYWELATPNHLYGDDFGQIIGALELHRATGEARFMDYLQTRTRQLAAGLNNDPTSYDWDMMMAGMHAAVLFKAIEYAPEIDDDGAVSAGVTAYLERLIELADNPVGLTQRVINGDTMYFSPTMPGVTVGWNAMYGSVAWAAHLAWQHNPDPRYLRLAGDQLDWILGANDALICQFEGAGARNLAGYHHRYKRIPGRVSGAVPGAVPNGFIRPREAPDQDRPWIDLGENRSSLLFDNTVAYESNEPWLPNSAFYLLALVTAPASPAPPAPDGGPPQPDGGGAFGDTDNSGGGDTDSPAGGDAWTGDNHTPGVEGDAASGAGGDANTDVVPRGDDTTASIPRGDTDVAGRGDLFTGPATPSCSHSPAGSWVVLAVLGLLVRRRSAAS